MRIGSVRYVGVTTATGRTLTLAEAVTTASTGDVWLFRGSTMADRAIRA